MGKDRQSGSSENGSGEYEIRVQGLIRFLAVLLLKFVLGEKCITGCCGYCDSLSKKYFIIYIKKMLHMNKEKNIIIDYIFFFIQSDFEFGF